MWSQLFILLGSLLGFVISMDGKIKLNSQKLKSLRKAYGVSQEGFIELLQQHNVHLSISSLKRAELGMYVRYRTARLISGFYQKDLSVLEFVTDEGGSDSEHSREAWSDEKNFAYLLRENARLRRLLEEKGSC